MMRRLSLVFVIFFVAIVGAPTLALAAKASVGTPIASTWQTASLPHFYLHYQLVDGKIAEQLRARAESIFQTITADLGFAPPRKIAVYLCPDAACFRQRQPSPDAVPKWAVGVAYPQLNRVILRSALRLDEGRINPVDVFTHEVAHIVLEQALAQRGGAPRWLSEGFAMYHAREWTLSGQRVIEEATLRNTFLPLNLLMTSFPADEKAARVAYAQSFSLVAFMLNDYGQTIFHKFIMRLQAGDDVNAALRHSAGVSLARFEMEWRHSLEKRYSWWTYLPEIGLFWFLISVGFFIAYLVKRHKSGVIQAQWEQEEQKERQAILDNSEFEDAPFWEEDE